MARTIKTEDGIELGEGDHAFDYYSMKPGVIGRMDDAPRTDEFIQHDQQGTLTPWFVFLHEDGTRQYLNGQRICSDAYARRRGWVK